MKTNLLSIILNIVILTSIASCSKQVHTSIDNKILELEISNKKYNQLTLFTEIRTQEGYDNGLEILGESMDGYKWTFVVPDSINQKVEGFLIKTQDFDYNKNEDGMLSFEVKGESQMKDSRIILKDKSTLIKGEYTHNFSNKFNGMAYILVDTFVMSPVVNYDVIKCY